MSRKALPSKACPSPTADLKSCSNLAWSVAVKNDNLIFGILALDADSWGAGDGCASLEENDAAI